MDESKQSPTDVIRAAAADVAMIRLRTELARFAADCYFSAGEELHVLGHIVGPDRAAGASPWGHGTDETVAVSLLLRIGSQLISGAGDLFADGRAYAAAALVRQVVEVEYLAWAIDTRDRDGERWLRSTREERESFFRPVRLRRAAGEGRFRGKDYGYHCELGGHPVPGSWMLFGTDPSIPQVLLSDLLGHVGRIWDHFVGWARRSDHGGPVLTRKDIMVARFTAWKKTDPLSSLPPPPDQ